MLTSKNFSDIVAFTRASAAWRYSSGGILVQESANVPRLSYDPTTLAARGLLIEEPRTNLYPQSNVFTATLTGATVTANARVAPDGTTSMGKLVEDTSNGTHRGEYTIGGTLLDNTTYCVSVYAAQGERRYVRLAAIGLNVNTNVATFDLQAGTVVSGTGVITPVSGGIYRCSVLFTTQVGPSSPGVRIYVMDGSNGTGGTDTYTGDGVSGIYVWGRQGEQGAFVTSYIPTSGAQAARAADLAQITDLSKIGFNANEGTLYAEAIAAPGIRPSGSQTMVAFDTGVADGNFLYIGRSSGRQAIAQVKVANVTQFSASVGAWSDLAAGKLAFAFKANDFAMSFNGSAATTGSSGPVPAVSRLMLSGFANDGGAIWGGWLKSLRYIPRRLSNAELQALTT